MNPVKSSDILIEIDIRTANLRISRDIFRFGTATNLLGLLLFILISLI